MALEKYMKVLSEKGGVSTVSIPTELLQQLRMAMANSEIKKATKKDIPTILGLEGIAFGGPDSTTLDPTETKEGMESFMKNGGEVFLLYRANGFFERIPLKNLMGIDYHNLDKDSPLRQICSRRDVLNRAGSYYAPTDKQVWYAHGIGVAIKGIKDGTSLMGQILKEQIKELAKQEEKIGRNIHVGYIDVGPERGNINVPSFRLCFNNGFVADGIESEVYVPGVPYLRVSHGFHGRHDVNKRKKEIVNLNDNGYLDNIKDVLQHGFVGAGLNVDKERMPSEMVFYGKR